MRRFAAGLVLIFLAACSSSGDKSAGITTPPTATPVASLRTLFDSVTVAASGGVLQYNKSGDPLNGLTVTIPAGAYAAASVWTIAADSNVVVTLPTGFTQVGPALAISTNQTGYATDEITLKMPLNVGTGNTVVPFYYNSATKRFEGIPTVDMTPTSITFATKNFSAASTTTGVTPTTALRSAADTKISCDNNFGGICVVWAKIADAQLQGTYTTTFQSGRDDWEFINYGDYAAPDGDCEGMSITAMYFQFYALADGGLYHKYDTSLSNQWDNVQGIRFAGSVQQDYAANFAKGSDQIAALNAAAGANKANNDPIKSLTSNWILSTLKFTGKPVLLNLRGSIGTHAVVAYAASLSGSETTVSFADPNFPGTSRTMKFTSGTLSPVSLQLNASATASTFDKAYALSVTSEVPLKSIDTRYAEFKAKTAGSDRYPRDYSWLSYNYGTRIFEPMPDVVRTSVGKFRAAVLCPSCTAKIQSMGDLQDVTVYDAAGQKAVPLDGNGDVTLNLGTTMFVLEATPHSPYSSTLAKGFLDSRSITVVYGPGTIGLSVTTAPVYVVPGAQATDVVQIDRTNYSSPVTITAVSDAGITITPSESPSLGNQTTVTINTPSNLVIGSTHIVTVTAVGADLTPVVTTFAVVAVAAPSYSLSVQTAPLNVTSGTSVTDSVSVTRTNFSGAITLSGAAPSGITVNFTGQPGTGTNGIFAVSVPDGVAPNTYSVTLTGASTIAPKTTTFAVVVTAPIQQSGYSFAVSPDPLAVEINHAPYPWTVTLNRAAYTGAVTVSATADDPGFVITPNSTANVGANVALSVRATAGTSVGTHTITLKGVAAGRIDQVTPFSVVTSLPTGGVPVGIVLTPAPVSVKSGATQQFTAYLVDAQGNRTLPESGWRIGILTDDSNVGHDVTSPAYDTTQRWQTHSVGAVGIGTTSVRAFYEKIVGGQSTFVSIATFTVTP